MKIVKESPMVYDTTKILNDQAQITLDKFNEFYQEFVELVDNVEDFARHEKFDKTDEWWEVLDRIYNKTSYNVTDVIGNLEEKVFD